MAEFNKYIGLDVHKEKISVAVADPGRGQPSYWGEIENRPEAVKRLLARLSVAGERLRLCYEAGPCGYELYRRIVAAGHDCGVVAPALIPRKPGERIKTNRRDSLSLARLDRAGELTAVWVPDSEQEAMRDLSRAREDMKIIDKQLRQRLNGFLLRQGRIWSGRGRWTQAHWRWLETQCFDSPYQQIVLEEYVEAVQAAQERTAELEKQLQEASESWSLRAAMQAAMALRGVDRTAAITLLAELDDLSRFENPRQLMSYVGLVPSERSSGDRRRQGAVTKAGNTHARRILVECAWAYRFPARKTARIQRRAEKAPAAVQAIAWQAQKRLCGRFRRLQARGVSTPKTVTAIARELCGFVWAVVCAVQRPGTFSAPA
jgi:transposase